MVLPHKPQSKRRGNGNSNSNGKCNSKCTRKPAQCNAQQCAERKCNSNCNSGFPLGNDRQKSKSLQSEARKRTSALRGECRPGKARDGRRTGARAPSVRWVKLAYWASQRADRGGRRG